MTDKLLEAKKFFTGEQGRQMRRAVNLSIRLSFEGEQVVEIKVMNIVLAQLGLVICL